MQNKMLSSTSLVTALLALALSSCAPSRTVIVEWKEVSPSIDPHLTLTYVVPSRSGNPSFHDVKLEKNKTMSIELPSDARIMGESSIQNAFYTIDPTISRIDSRTKLLVVYTYSTTVTKMSEENYRISTGKDVEGYFVQFLKDGKVYTVVSKDSDLHIDFRSIRRPTSLVNFELEFSKKDIILENAPPSGSGTVIRYAGYIVDSEIDHRYLWLTNEYDSVSRY